jgi:hypothetical protein
MSAARRSRRRAPDARAEGSKAAVSRARAALASEMPPGVMAGPDDGLQLSSMPGAAAFDGATSAIGPAVEMPRGGMEHAAAGGGTATSGMPPGAMTAGGRGASAASRAMTGPSTGDGPPAVAIAEGAVGAIELPGAWRLVLVPAGQGGR